MTNVVHITRERRLAAAINRASTAIADVARLAAEPCEDDSHDLELDVLDLDVDLLDLEVEP